MSAADEVDPAEFPHLKITPAELEAAYEADAVIRQHLSDIEHYTQVLGQYPMKMQEHQQLLSQTEVQMSELQGQLKALDAQCRTIKGAITSTRFHESATRQRILEKDQAVRRRKAQIYHREVTVRLGRLKKELNLVMERKPMRKNGLDSENETRS